MQKEAKIGGTAILLSLQRGLLGAVKPNLRAVTCDWTDHSVHIRAIVDGPVSDEDRDLMAIAATEVSADLPFDWEGDFHDEVVRVDAPGSVKEHLLKHTVYNRYEP